MEFKREIFFRKKEEEIPKESGYIFDIENFDPHNDKDVEYLDKLKEEDESEYYRILEKLVEKDILKEETYKIEDEGLGDDYIGLSEIRDIRDLKDDPGEEYYGRFNEFKKPKNKEKPQIKIDSKPAPYKKDNFRKILDRYLSK